MIYHRFRHGVRLQALPYLTRLFVNVSSVPPRLTPQRDRAGQVPYPRHLPPAHVRRSRPKTSNESDLSTSHAPTPTGNDEPTEPEQSQTTTTPDWENEDDNRLVPQYRNINLAGTFIRGKVDDDLSQFEGEDDSDEEDVGFTMGFNVPCDTDVSGVFRYSAPNNPQIVPTIPEPEDRQMDPAPSTGIIQLGESAFEAEVESQLPPFLPSAGRTFGEQEAQANHRSEAPPDAQQAPCSESLMSDEDCAENEETNSWSDGPNPNYVPVDDFHMAVMVLMTATDMSHAQYTAFLETMAFATVESIKSLPKSLTTLRERCRRNFPLMTIRSHDIPVALRSLPPKRTTPAKAYTFSIEEYAKLWLRDQRIRHKMHFGMALHQPYYREFYHADAWSGSIRSTSGEFAFLPPPENSEPLFPSDCVAFHNTPTSTAYLRIYGVLKDPEDGHHVVLGKRLLLPEELPSMWQQSWPNMCGQIIAEDQASERPMYPNMESELPELILMEEDRLVIPVSHIIRKIWVHMLDYPESVNLTPILLPVEPTYCVRFIAYKHNGFARAKLVHKRYRIPAEHELGLLGRQYCLETFVQKPGDSLRRLLIPFTLFLDDFRLYRNTYCRLGAVYIQPAGLDEPSRFTLQNMFVLMVTPFGSCDRDIASCLQEKTIPLGQGLRTIVETSPGMYEEVILTVFPICITGDMPQQNENAGLMSHKSLHGCRYCFIHADLKGDLYHDVQQDGRYRAPHDHLRWFLEKTTAELGVKARDDRYKAYGTTPNSGVFAPCFPILDPFTCFPNDPMHAELRLAKYFNAILVTDLLSECGRDAYSAAWNILNIPYGWSQPQNPVTHSGSMVFSEHGRVALLNPFVLMLMFGMNTNDSDNRQFADSSRRTYFKRGFVARVTDHFQKPNLPANAADILLQAAWATARVVYLTMKASLDCDEWTTLPEVVREVHLLVNN